NSYIKNYFPGRISIIRAATLRSNELNVESRPQKRWGLRVDFAMIEAPPLAAVKTERGTIPSNGSSMIKVCSLKKRIGQQEILSGVDLEVRTGETLAIIGRSGGGKSVLLKHLVGLME